MPLPEIEAPYELTDVLDNLSADLGSNRMLVAQLRAQVRKLTQLLEDERIAHSQLKEWAEAQAAQAEAQAG